MSAVSLTELFLLNKVTKTEFVIKYKKSGGSFSCLKPIKIKIIPLLQEVESDPDQLI